MCKSPLFASRWSPYFQDEFGEFHKDTKFFDDPEHTGKLRFLRISRAEFEKRQAKNLLDNNHLDYFEVPCGQCIECRLRKSREWAARIMCEAQFSDNSAFVTLTYDDLHLPIGSKGVPSLDFDHLKKFLKDFRRFCEYHYGVSGVRFYGAGEYGESSARPHFHLCLFDLPQQLVDKNKYWSRSPLGDLYYRNEDIEKVWQRGNVIVADLTFQSAAYVSRYVTKKMTGDKADKYDILGIQPEKALMSRRPGIGREFYDKYKYEIYTNDEFFLPGKGTLIPTKYFDKLYNIDDPAHMEIVKSVRSRSADRAKQAKLRETGLSYDDVLKAEEENIKSRIKVLTRRKI